MRRWRWVRPFFTILSNASSRVRDERRGVLLLRGGVQSKVDDVAQTTRIAQEQSDSAHEIRQFMRMTKQREAIRER